MKYLTYLEEFRQNETLYSREIQCDTEKEAFSCYTSLRKKIIRDHVPYVLYLRQSQKKVLISKEPLYPDKNSITEDTDMTIRDNIDTTSYAENQIKYQAKYAQIFTDFLTDATLKNRELTFTSPSKVQSCAACLKRYIKQFGAENTVQIQTNRKEKTILLKKIG